MIQGEHMNTVAMQLKNVLVFPVRLIAKMKNVFASAYFIII